MNNDYNPDYELFLETTNKIKHFEEILFMIDLDSINRPESKEHYKTIKQLCNKEIRKLYDIINSFE